MRVFVRRSKSILSAFALVISGASVALAAPQRVVSMNLCTDQLAYLLADHDQIMSLSSIADDPYSSAIADVAKDFHRNTSDAEEIYLMQPDLVLAGQWTAQASVQMLRDLGITVEIFPPENTMDDIRANILRMAELVGHPERGQDMLATFNADLDALQSGITTRPRAALYYANGYTTGEQTLAGQILAAAGFDNVAAEAGITWGATMPLEQLVMLQPDVVITGTVYPGSSRSEEILSHPVLQPMRHVATTGAKWVCGTPFVIDAIKELQTEHPDKGANK